MIIDKIKKIFYSSAFPLVLLVLLLSSCTKSNSNQNLLDTKTISLYESLYEKNKEVVLDALNLSSDDIRTDNGLFMIASQNRTICNESFQVVFTYDTLSQHESFSGVTFTFQTTDKSKATSLVQELFETSKSAYGEPSTYEGLTNRISKSQQLLQNTIECWDVGTTSEYTLRADTIENTVSITLTYRQKNND